MEVLMMSGGEGSDKNSTGRARHNYKDNPWVSMDLEPREANYLNKVSLSLSGLTNDPIPEPKSSGQGTRLMECPEDTNSFFFSSCISPLKIKKYIY